MDLNFIQTIDLQTDTNPEAKPKLEDFALRKREIGVIHASDIQGIFRANTPFITLKEEEAIVDYIFEIVVVSKDEIRFSCTLAELKEAYEKLSEFYIKHKNNR